MPLLHYRKKKKKKDLAEHGKQDTSSVHNKDTQDANICLNMAEKTTSAPH